VAPDESAAESTGPARPPFSPTIALVTVARVVEVRLATVLEPHGLTLRKYGILGHIAATPGLSLSDLARRSQITVQSVHVLIRSLVQAGWVRSETEVNGLAAQVTVTPAGLALLSALRAELAGFDAEVFGSEAWEALSAALALVVAENTR
jgi:DNA-binding MarR family transcriptional regulator